MKVIIGYRLLYLPLKKTREVPSNWSELSPDQLFAVAEIYAGTGNEIELLHRLCNVPRRVVRWMDDFQRYCLLDLFEFINKYAPCSTFLIPCLGNLYAPKPKLEGVTFGQFIFIETYYDEWAETEDSASLDKFIASLYLPKDAAFSTAIIKQNTGSLVNLSPVKKLAITINYRLIKEWIRASYPIIFDPGKKRREQPKADDGWIKLFRSIVGDDIIHEDKYANLPIHTVLAFIQRKIKEDAKRN